MSFRKFVELIGSGEELATLDSTGTLQRRSVVDFRALIGLKVVYVRGASTANIATLSGALTHDGITYANNENILLKNQSTANQNGVYRINTAGAWTRSVEHDSSDEIRQRDVVCTSDGTINKMGYAWCCTNTRTITVGTTSIAFAQYPVGLGTGATQAAAGNHTHTLAGLSDLGTNWETILGATKPTTLAGYGITDAQLLDADLTAIAALSGTSGFLKKTAANVWTLDAYPYAPHEIATSTSVHITQASPYTLDITGYRRIQIWAYNSSSFAQDLTIAPSGGGSCTITHGPWTAFFDIVLDGNNYCIVNSNSALGSKFNHFASGASTSLELSTTTPGGWSWTITRIEKLP